MNTEDLEEQLLVTTQALEKMFLIVESMEKLLQVTIEELETAVAYIQASEVINKAKL